MKEIIIVGAGDLGKEVVWLIEDINKHCPTYLILGFLDNDSRKTGKKFCGYQVLGSTKLLDEKYNNGRTYAVIALQDGSIRKKIVSGCNDFKLWEKIIHPSAVIAPSSRVGEGSVVFPNVTVSVDTQVGSFGLLYIQATVCNDCMLGNYVSVMSNAQVSERVGIGDECYLAAGSNIYPHRKLGSHVKVAVGAVVSKDCANEEKVGMKGMGFSLFK